MDKPKIRFKGYTEVWKQCKLGDVYAAIGNAFVGTATPYYVEYGHFYLEANNVKDGQINHNSEIFINDEFYEKQRDKWLHTGDMVMVQSGHVGHAAVIPEELDNTAAHALIMFRNPKVNIEPYFLNYQYQTSKSKKKIENITTGNTIKHILASDMQNFIVDIPDYAEQGKIAQYFRNLDHLITLHQRKCEEVKKLKKYMLQNMFPRNGRNVPEIRFDGFTNAWEQRKLGEAAEYRRGSFPQPYGNKDWYDGEGAMPFVQVADVTDEMNLVADTKQKISKLAQPMSVYADKNSVLVTLQGSIGRVAITQYGAFVDRTVLIFEKYKKEIDYIFWAYIIKQKFIEEAKKAPGGTIKTITKETLSDFDLMLPEYKEQMKIGQYFSTLDHLITLHQRKLESLRTLKKFMLEKMFV